jgi:hypothetical protein
MSHAGPKTSALVVMPVLAAAGAVAGAMAAGALGGLAAGVLAPLHAVSATVNAAMEPSAAMRWIVCTGVSS